MRVGVTKKARTRVKRKKNQRKNIYIYKEKSSDRYEEKSNHGCAKKCKNKSEEKKTMIKKVMTRVDKEILLHYF